jgi:Protein of unknown function (DUF3309)
VPPRWSSSAGPRSRGGLPRHKQKERRPKPAPLVPVLAPWIADDEFGKVWHTTYFGGIKMSLGLILVIILIIILLGGFSGRIGGYGYGYGHRGIGIVGIILIVLLVLLLMHRI